MGALLMFRSKAIGPRMAALVLVLGSLAPGARGDVDVLASSVGEELRRAIEQGQGSGHLEAGGDPILARSSLLEVYEQRGFEPAWTSDGGISPVAIRALAALGRAAIHGLRAEDYHREALAALVAEARAARARGEQPETATLAAIDLLLSDATLLYAAHLAAGKTDPTTLHAEWRARRPELQPARFLGQLLESGDPGGAFETLLPRARTYAELERALARLRRTAAAGGWPAVPPGPPLHPGDTSARVPALAARLAASGDLPNRAIESAHGELYTPEIVAAVETFQRRHGLDADGVIGAKTLAALTVPVEDRIDQVLVNLERWRWLPRELGARHLEINIAGFDLRAVDTGRVALSMRVIVGKSYTRTPVFSEDMTYLVINPYWNVPESIARDEILAKVQANPSYLAEQSFRLFAGTGPGAAEVDPSSVDWSAVTPETFSYFVRQEPGPGNSLGRIKFMFPNPYNVYLHDTPEKGLFAQARRSFSHGCIRIEKPQELATFLLQDDPSWSADRLQSLIDSDTQHTVTLDRPVPVHVLYWTAWVDEEGLLQIREDIYDRDRPVIAALRRAPPSAR